MLLLHLRGRPNGFDTDAEDGTVFDGGWAEDGTISNGCSTKDGTVSDKVRVLKLEAEYNASSFNLSTVSDGGRTNDGTVSDTHAISTTSMLRFNAEDGTVFDGGWAEDGTVSADDATDAIATPSMVEIDDNNGAVFDGCRAKDGNVSDGAWAKGGTDDTVFDSGWTKDSTKDGTVSDIGWAEGVLGLEVVFALTFLPLRCVLLPTPRFFLFGIVLL